jgi:hypothetical protein
VLGRFSIFNGHHLILDRICVVVVTIGSVLVAFSGESIMGLLDIQLSIAMVTLFVPLAMGVFLSPAGELAGYLPMLVGAAVWWSRFAFERFYITSDAIASKTLYPQHVFDQLSVMGLGDTLASIGYFFALIPADILGLIASICAYFVGRALSKPQPSMEHDESIPAEA